MEAEVAPAFTIAATGRNAELCGALEANLILETYRDVLSSAGRVCTRLQLKLHNEIPLGMGCGSSAAAILAGVALANYFGELHLGDSAIVDLASRREGHPDNVAACWYGGFTVAAMDGEAVQTATFVGDPAWQLLLALPATSLSTKTARALLPESYAKSDAVFNVQRSSLLVAAFGQQKLSLLSLAMQDRLHQPYRMQRCPLLQTLLPLAEEPEIAGVALSGAGPAVLLILSETTTLLAAETRLASLVGSDVEILPLRIGEAAQQTAL